MARLLVTRSSVSAPAPALLSPDRALATLLGQPVLFASHGERLAGRALRLEDRRVVVDLAVPDRSGCLVPTGSELTVPAADLEPASALVSAKRVAAFEAGASLSLAPDRSAPSADSTSPRDYLDLVIEGHASTFGTPAQVDRGGEYVMPGAFDVTLAEFRQNPVMLVDHANDCASLAGSWERVELDPRGLHVVGRLSNAPGLRDLRYKLAEGHLKGLSIGGIWYYDTDGRGIAEADLFEISLTPLPMNPATLAHTRALGEADCRKAFARYWRRHRSLRDAP